MFNDFIGKVRVFSFAFFDVGFWFCGSLGCV